VIVALLAAAAALPLSLSHAWIVVKTGAPERAIMEKAGFRFAPEINHHDGQGTASVSVEFLNGYFELLYPDPTVPVSPDLKAGAEKFRLKSEWRTSGYSPIGIVFERTPMTPATFPFPTWRVSAEWMGKGRFIEMLTPKEAPKCLSLSISPFVEGPHDARDPRVLHPNGTRRLTALHVVAPAADRLPPSASWIASQELMKFDIGEQWLLDVTLDDGKQGITKDFRPDLPMIVRY
jgi:hypothetical protein